MKNVRLKSNTASTKHLLCLLLSLLLLLSCEKDDASEPEIQEEETYFPPAESSEWETTTVAELGWNQAQLNELFTFLENNNTRALIILKNGKIVVENYWGRTITEASAFDSSSLWYWASAGKSLTATLVGIAQQEGLLDINDKTSDYLREGWSSLPSEKESLITIKNQLSMTTGLEYDVADLDCSLPSCLVYRKDAGSQWFYHNAPYSLLKDVIENASGISYNAYTDQKLESSIGMKGQWISQGYNNVYWSTPRDMARFGLFILNKGRWNKAALLSDETYYNEMINSSQDRNLSYGYLWWLNGKNSIILPGLSNSIPMELASEAPEDLIAALGKNGQMLDVIPSQNLVVVRMGNAPDASLISSSFHNQMWEKLALVMGY